MIAFLVGLTQFILEIIGAMTVAAFIFVFFGFQKKTIFAKKIKLFGYQFTAESASGKQLKVEVRK